MKLIVALLSLTFLFVACSKSDLSNKEIIDAIKPEIKLSEFFKNMNIVRKNLVETRKMEMKKHLFNGTCKDFEVDIKGIATESLRIGGYAISDESYNKIISDRREFLKTATKNGECLGGALGHCIKYKKIPLTEEEKKEDLNRKIASLDKDFPEVFKKGDPKVFKTRVIFCVNDQIDPKKWELSQFKMIE